ncbi:MAG: glycosyltransferase [Actinobacteria bacterium]|nr:glycosyltransferase [Actinomycetota bacterium]
MRIALVSEHASPLAVVGGVDAGGQNVHVAELANALADRGHHIVVYTRRDDPHLPTRVTMRSRVTVEHVCAGPAAPIGKDDLLPHIPQFGQQLQECLRNERPAVVHAHFWMSGLAALAAAGPLALPVVQTFHALGSVKRRYQGSADTSPPERIGLERTVIDRVQRVVASCDDERRELVELGAEPDRVVIVPSGVSLTHFTPEGRAARRCRPRLLSIGRLVARKGHDDAIRVIAAHPQAELLIVGGPEAGAFESDSEVRRLRALARELKMEDRVRLTGRLAQAELPALLRSADAVLCLPWYEPFGIVPLEAMACGVPVIGSAVGGLLDTVRDGDTGLLVPPRDVPAASAAVTELLEDTAFRDRMGKAARDRAEDYEWSSVAARAERAYVAAIHAHRTNRPVAR